MQPRALTRLPLANLTDHYRWERDAVFTLEKSGSYKPRSDKVKLLCNLIHLEAFLQEIDGLKYLS